MIFSIVGDESPIVSGLTGSESGISLAIESVPPIVFHDENLEIGDGEDSTSGEAIVPSTKKIIRKHHCIDRENIEKKRILQINVLELEKYKLQLETFKLEQDLNIQHSDLTKSLLDKVIL